METSLEQAWLCEAVTDTYLPLLGLIERIKPDRAVPLFTLSISPSLLELWGLEEFPARYQIHLTRGLEILEHESTNPKHPLERRTLACQLKTRWEHTAEHFEAIGCDLIRAFTKYATEGRIELITTTATHAFLPAYQTDRRFRQFQIQNGLETFRRRTGLRPEGFWLPECGYFPGLEEDLAPYGIRYFGLEEKGLNAADPPVSSSAPLQCANGMLALGRNAALSQMVWNARVGYPGHPDYREFHHDGIHDIDSAVCGLFALPEGGRLPLGLKYWRVTGSEEKDWYNPETAARQARSDADKFVAYLAANQSESDERELVFLPFDAELFGHWWHEGPVWLEAVLTRAAQMPGIAVQSVAASCAGFPNPVTGRPAASTWGLNGDYSFWINHDTDWLYPLLREASDGLERLCRGDTVGNHSSLGARALRQAARELLLAGASDWPFMLRAGATVQYAMQRLRDHLGRFFYLKQQVENGTIDPDEIELLERMDPAFEEIMLDAFSGSK